MKILHVMSSVSQGSGVAQVVMSYYRLIKEECSFDFLIFYDTEKSFDREIDSHGGKIYVSGKPGIKNALSYCRFLKKFFKEHEGEYDAIHLHELYMNAIVLPYAKKYGDIGVRIAHSHATKSSDTPSKELRNKLLCKTLRKTANVFFACSKDAGIVGFGAKICDSDSFFLIKNAINTSEYVFNERNRAFFRQKWGSDEKTIVIGNVGRLASPKNQVYLLKIFTEIVKLYENTRLVLIGDGPMEDELKTTARDYGVADKVLFTGSVSNVSEYLSAMDVFVLPSRFEGLGKVLIEAQCNGLLCVASDRVPQEAFINPNCYSRSIDEQPTEWAQYIINSGMERYENAKEMVEKSNYDIDKEAQNLLQLYRSLTRNKNNKA